MLLLLYRTFVRSRSWGLQGDGAHAFALGLMRWLTLQNALPLHFAVSWVPKLTPPSPPLQNEVLAQYPPKPPAEGEPPPGLHDMIIFTKGPKDYWPAERIPWLQDAYPIPHFVQEMQDKERQAAAEEGMATATPTGTSPKSL